MVPPKKSPMMKKIKPEAKRVDKPQFELQKTVAATANAFLKMKDIILKMNKHVN